MAFDPDKYLAAKSGPQDPASGFDPDAYLASKTGAEERPEWLNKPNHLVAAAQKKQHSLDDLSAEIARGKQVNDRENTVGNALMAGAQGVTTYGSDVLDTATLGGYRAARNAIGGLISPETAQGWQAADDAEHAGMQEDAVGRMAIAPAGTAVGSMIGAPAKIAEAASAGARALGGAVPGALGRMLSTKPVQGALTGAGSGVATSLGTDVIAGSDMNTTLENAKGSAIFGGAIGAGMAVPSAVASGARSARTALRNPQGEIGRTIAGLDKAKASGVMETKEFKALPKGAAGFNQAAATAEERLAAHNQGLLKQARKQYGQDLEDILKDHASRPDPQPAKLTPLVSQPSSRRAAERAFAGDSFDELTGGGHTTMGGNTVAAPGRKAAPAMAGQRHYLASDTHEVLNKMDAENMVNGEMIDDHLAKAISKTRRMLTTNTGTRAGGGTMLQAPAAKLGDLIKVKKAIGGLADYDNPATPETRPYRIIEKAIARDMEAIDPRIGEMNKRYAKTMDQLEQANEILYGSQNPDMYRSVSKQKRARGLLGRVGDETQAATLAEKDIARLKELDPKYSEIVDLVEAKKNFERSRIGLPQVSRRIESLPFAFAKQNATALGARVLDPILGRLSGSGRDPSSVPAMLIRAAEEKRKRAAENAARLRGGM